EKELLHMYVTSHPLKQYRRTLALNKFQTLEAAKQLKDRYRVKVVAIVQQLRKVRTRRGESMAFITFSDETDEMEGVVFPSVFREVSSWLAEEAIVQVEGKISIREGNKQIVLDRVHEIEVEQLAQAANKFIYIKADLEREAKTMPFLKRAAEQYPGETAIILYNVRLRKTYKLSARYKIAPTEASLHFLRQFFGEESVVYK